MEIITTIPSYKACSQAQFKAGWELCKLIWRQVTEQFQAQASKSGIGTAPLVFAFHIEELQLVAVSPGCGVWYQYGMGHAGGEMCAGTCTRKWRGTGGVKCAMAAVQNLQCKE